MENIKRNSLFIHFPKQNGSATLIPMYTDTEILCSHTLKRKPIRDSEHTLTHWKYNTKEISDVSKNFSADQAELVTMVSMVSPHG